LKRRLFILLVSHQETGNGFTYRRDLDIANWCKEQKISWVEYPQFGVVRPLKNRDHWQGAWEKHMAQTQFSSNVINFWRNLPKAPIHISTPKFLYHNPPQRQRGGRTQALSTFQYFYLKAAQIIEVAYHHRY
jgi:deoxyribodipyrimidine photo-lyase